MPGCQQHARATLPASNKIAQIRIKVLDRAARSSPLIECGSKGTSQAEQTKGVSEPLSANSRGTSTPCVVPEKLHAQELPSPDPRGATSLEDADLLWSSGRPDPDFLVAQTSDVDAYSPPLRRVAQGDRPAAAVLVSLVGLTGRSLWRWSGEERRRRGWLGARVSRRPSRPGRSDAGGCF